MTGEPDAFWFEDNHGGLKLDGLNGSLLEVPVPELLELEVPLPDPQAASASKATAAPNSRLLTRLIDNLLQRTSGPPCARAH